MSSISGSSVNSSNHPQEDESPIRRIGGGGGDDSISEKWALASSNCSDAKEYLEMICCDLSEELSQFDLRKEQELRQVFLDLAAGQMEKNEKVIIVINVFQPFIVCKVSFPFVVPYMLVSILYLFFFLYIASR